MFDFTFVEVLVIVTGASFVLGRKDLMLGARHTGKVLGRLIGTMHGVKANYEAKSQQTELKSLHTTVTSGLRDLSTVGYDILSVSPMRMMSSPLGLSQSYSTNNPIHGKTGAVPNSGPVAGSESISPTYSQFSRPTMPLPLHDEPKRFTDAGKIFAPSSMASLDLSEEAYRATANNRHLARIIIAERDLKLRMEYEANSYNNGRNQSSQQPATPEGADIVQSVISECILADTYR